jgi:hypothetical protein
MDTHLRQRRGNRLQRVSAAGRRSARSSCVQTRLCLGSSDAVARDDVAHGLTQRTKAARFSDLSESELGSLSQPPVAVGDGAQLAGQPELSEAGQRLPGR